MCGIAGFTRFGGAIGQPDEVVRGMAGVLAHRGPDGEGYFLSDGVALGHRRLSIIDLESGGQPMTTPDGRFTIVFNGEIYNYIELRDALARRGVAFRTRSDTEVALQALALDGPQALQSFNGMFALAVWDARERSLFVARDRMGVKPLYYAETGADFVFGSELKSLTRYPGLSRTVDALSFSKFLTFGYVPAPHTIYREIRKLEPGHYVRFDRASGARTTPYWDIPLEDDTLNDRRFALCVEGLRDLLQDAVAKRLRADVATSVFLSGGIDSATVTALAARVSPGPVRTFSIGFEEASYDESPYAREVSRLYGTEHHHEVLSEARAIAALPGAMRHLDEPFADASFLPTYLLSRVTASSVKVALSGDGGDELFAGYPSFQAHKLVEALSFMPVGWRDAINRWASRLPVSHGYASAGHLLGQFFKGAGVSASVRFMLWMGCFGNEQRQMVLAPDVRAALMDATPFEDVFRHVHRSGLKNDFERLLYVCAKLYLQDGVLVKVDRASMANSLEVRSPFLDYRVVEYAARILPEYKLHGLFGSKHILKHAVRDLLPPRIVNRRKAGFMMPLASWLTGGLRPMVEDLCSEAALRRSGLFDVSATRRMIDDHLAGRRDYRKEVWAVLAFQEWGARHA